MQGSWYPTLAANCQEAGSSTPLCSAQNGAARAGLPGACAIREDALCAGVEEVFEAGAPGVGGHGGLDFQSQRQCFPALTGGDLGWAAGANGFQE